MSADPMRRVLTEYFLLDPKAIDHKATQIDWSDTLHDLQFEESMEDKRNYLARSLGMYARPMTAAYLAGLILKELEVEA